MTVEKFAAVSFEVEKADRKKGIIVFKCCAAEPGLEDLDGHIADEASMEAAFYDFLENQPEVAVDLEHKEAVPGRIVAGWWFGPEHCGRVAFKPTDPAIVQMAEDGEFVGSSYNADVELFPIY